MSKKRGGNPYGPTGEYLGGFFGSGINAIFGGVPFYANSPISAISIIRRVAESSSLVQSYIRNVKVNVVGKSGPRPTFSGVTNGRDRNRLEQLWADWSETPTDDGQTSWAALMRLMVGSWARDGRALVLMRQHTDYPHRFAVRPLSRDWLVSWYSSTSTPIKDDDGKPYDLVGGRLLGKVGQVEAYALWGDAENNNAIVNNNSNWIVGPRALLTRGGGPIIVPASKIADFMSPAEADDVIGFPALMLPMVSMLGHIARLDESTAIAMEGATEKMGFITHEQGSMAYQVPADKDKKYMPPNQFERNVIEALPAGYDFQSFEPGAPNRNIEEYRRALVKNIAAAVGVDYAGFSGDLREVNFSSIRQGVQNARENYEVGQNDLEMRVCRPILKKLLETQRLAGEMEISDRSYIAAIRSSWRHRSWAYVDPLKEIKASETMLSIGATSLQDICSRHGLDWRDVLQEVAEVKKEVERLGLEDYIDNPKEASGITAESDATVTEDEE